MAFEFATAARIIFGEGESKKVGGYAAEFGKRAFIVTGEDDERAAPLINALNGKGIPFTRFTIEQEPTIPLAEAAVELCRRDGCDVVISMGGGSVVDTGKAISALVTNPGEPMDYLEVIGRGKTLTIDPLPFIAMPTTSGTGAEVTKNAVLKSETENVKVSVRHPKMLPRIAIVDPELTYSVPPNVTAQTGLDALTQVIEPYVSNSANPLTDGIAREGIMRGSRSLLRAFKDGLDKEARRDMALVSLMGGLSLANAKLGAVHGFAAPIGGMYPIPHGAVCGILLPFVVKANIKALQTRYPGHPTLKRFDEIGQIVTGDHRADADAGAAWLENLCGELALPGLGYYGVKKEHIPDIVEKSRVASSMKGNPIELTPEELTGILEAAL